MDLPVFQNWIVPKMSFPTLDYGYDLSACLDQAVSKYVVLKRFLFDGPSCFQTWIVPK